MKYFKVTAKCGHVGKNNYYKGELFIKAENGREAAKIARAMPRVKHEHKDAILSVVRIDFDSYINGKKQVRDNPYFTCESKQMQNLFFEEIENMIFVDDYLENQKSTTRTKKHSLRNIYNDDPIYEFYKNNMNSFNYNFVA